MRVVHYLNQFFGGLGGEEKAGTPLEKHEGADGANHFGYNYRGDGRR
jgi:hypothetical protein